MMKTIHGRAMIYSGNVLFFGVWTSWDVVSGRVFSLSGNKFDM